MEGNERVKERTINCKNNKKSRRETWHEKVKGESKGTKE